MSEKVFWVVLMLLASLMVEPIGSVKPMFPGPLGYVNTLFFGAGAIAVLLLGCFLVLWLLLGMPGLGGLLRGLFCRKD